MARDFLDFVARYEGTEGHPKARGYNTTLDYGRWTGGPVDLTGMTLDEIDALQTRMLADPENRAKYKANGLSGSSALGRYQIVRKTLRQLREDMGLKGDERFTPELQDKLAERLMTGRGRSVEALRNEWAGLRRADPNAILAKYDGGTMTDAPFSREEIQAELQRRQSAPSFSREEIEAELQRRMKVREKEAIGGMVDQVVNEDPNAALRAEEEAARQLRLSYAEPDPEEAPTVAATDMNMGDVLTMGGTRLWPAIAGEAGETGRALVNEGAQGYTAGFGDEVAAFINTAPVHVASWLREQLGFSPIENARTYDEEVGRLRGERDAAREGNEVASTVANIAGGALAAAPIGGGLVGAARGAGLGTTGQVAAGAAEGAGFGALYGAGEADEGSRLAGAAEGAAGGAIAGGILARAGVGLERFLKARALAKAAPNIKDFRQASSQMIQAAENVAITYKPSAARALADDVINFADDVVLDKKIHKNAFALYRNITKHLENGQPLTFKKLIRLRQLAGDAAFAAQKGSADARYARQILDRLDDFAIDEGNMLAAAGGTANGRRAVELRREGARAWSQYKKAETIENLIEDTILHANSLDSGGNVSGSLRREFSKLHRRIRAGKLKGWTPDEIEAVRMVAEQGLTNDVIRVLGKTAPSGSALMAVLQTGGAVGTGGWSLLALPAAEAAKFTATRMTTNRAKAVLQTILTGGKVPPSKIEQLTRAERRAIARAISAKVGELNAARTPEATATAR